MDVLEKWSRGGPAKRDREVRGDPVSRRRPASRAAPLRMALWYALSALAWVFGTDQLLRLVGLPPGVELVFGSVKGALFVVVTASILYVLVARYMARIEASEERYRRVFENAIEGVTTFHVLRDERGDVSDLEVADVNPAQTRRSGLPRERLVGVRTAAARELGDEMRAYFAVVRDAAVDGTARRVEIHVADVGAYVLASVFPFEDDLWAIAGSDITQVRRAQEALRRQDERIRQAYEDVLDAVTGGKLVLMTEREIHATLGAPLTPEAPIGSAEQLAGARGRIAAAVRARFPEADVCPLLNAAGEALNNALKHAGGGTYEVFEKDGTVQVEVSDHGGGIDFRTLPRATLVPGFSTTATLGMGFTIMLQLADCVRLATRPEGTDVVLEIRPHAGVAACAP